MRLTHGVCLCWFDIFSLYSNSVFSSLRLIAPVVRVHGVEYQQGKFKAKVENGTYTLERVKVIFSVTCDDPPSKR